MILKKSFHLLSIGCLLFAITGSLYAAELTIDALTFKADSGRVYVEIHIDYPRSALTHKKVEDGWYGAANFVVLIQRDSITLASDEWRLEDVAANPEALAAGQRIVDARIYQMLPGTYEVSVAITDSLTGTRIARNRIIEVLGFADDKFSASDLQLAAHVLGAGVHPRFDRGGFSIIPNPRRLFAPPGPINYYLEIYPSVGDTIQREYLFKPSLLLGSTNRLKFLQPQTRLSNSAFAVIDTFSTVGLPGDTYYLHLDIICEGDTIQRRSKFFVYLPDSLKAFPVEETFDSLTIAGEFAQVEFLLEREQVAEAANMTINQKGLLLRQFWRRYDDDPSTPEVPLRKVFRMRVKEADDRWTNSRSPGHQSDRGRVYVLHGEPDDREIHTLDSHAKPYEAWTYNSLQGGAFFAFVDRSALGEFTLVHSTLRGEVYNPDWYEVYVIKSTVDTRK